MLNFFWYMRQFRNFQRSVSLSPYVVQSFISSKHPVNTVSKSRQTYFQKPGVFGSMVVLGTAGLWLNTKMLSTEGENTQTEKLLTAIKENREEEVKKLVVVNPALISGNQFSLQKCHNCLHVAISLGSMGSFFILLNAGANTSWVDSAGKTPLHIAAECGSIECVRALLRAGAEIDCIDNEGYTPLHHAVEYILLNSAAKTGNKIDKIPYAGSQKMNILGVFFESDLPREKVLRVFFSPRVKGCGFTPFQKFVSTWDMYDELDSQSIVSILHAATGLAAYFEDFFKEVTAGRNKLIKDAQYSAKEYFKYALLDQLNTSFYADKVIWTRQLSKPDGDWKHLFDIAQLATGLSESSVTRVAATLGNLVVRYYTSDLMAQYRRSSTTYVDRFKEYTFSRVAEDACEQVAERFQHQLSKLTPEGIRVFSRYFHDKLMKHLRSSGRVEFQKIKGKSVPLSREFIDAMLDPLKGESMTLLLRDKDAREINSSIQYSWDTKDLLDKTEVRIPGRVLGYESEEEQQRDYVLRPQAKISPTTSSRPYGYIVGDEADLIRYQRCGSFWKRPCKKGDLPPAESTSMPIVWRK